MKNILTLTFLYALCVSCNTANQQRPSAKYEEKKQSLEDMERASPLKFLKITGSHHNNVVKQVVVEGEIKNTATLVAFRNIEVQVTYLDKSGSVIEKDKSVLDNVAQPNSTLDFKIKTKHVKGMSSAALDITNAMPDK